MSKLTTKKEIEKPKWLLCDMHMHSFYSRIKKNSEKSRTKKMTAQEYVETLKKHKVNIFSITDHNYFSSKYYSEIETYINNHNYDMCIIPGVELDVFIKEISDYIHICVYFEKNVNLSELGKVVDDIYPVNDEKEKPDLIKIIKKLSSLNSKYIIIPHGDKGDDRGIFNIIKNHNFFNIDNFYRYAMYKIYNAYDVKPSFIELSSNHWAAAFYNNTKSFKEKIKLLSDEEIMNLKEHIVNKLYDKTSSLTNVEEEIYNYLLEYGSYFAYFSFSDWHNKEEYNPSINNFIFGNIKNSFESFELATLDPVSRIIQSLDDHIEIKDSILSKVDFKIDDNINTINFTPGLNAIVGKRGSGKSLLVSILRNLKDKDDKNGALKVYDNLNIDNIKGANRAGIDISLGSLNSAIFLSQNDIDDIFKDMSKAEENIKKYFISPKSIDKSKMQEICDISSEIKPYNKNYKNITANISYIKKSNNYLFKEYEFDMNEDFVDAIDDAIDQLNIAEGEISKTNINTDELLNIIKKINEIKKKYELIFKAYKEIIYNHNSRIEKINKEISINDERKRANIEAINNALRTIFQNLSIKEHYEKTKHLIDKFTYFIPEVKLNIKNKYLFVSYYEVPADMKDTILSELTGSLKHSTQDFCDIEMYMDGEKKLITQYKNLSDKLGKFIISDVFDYKQRMYEIKNPNIDYLDIVKDLEDINRLTNSGSLIDISNSSLGVKSVAYIDLLFNLDTDILIFDQPEDNIDNDYISTYLVPEIKKNKKTKQMIFVTHNPSVAVYGDAFNYIYANNDNGFISYSNYFIEKQDDKKKIMEILDGGIKSFANRNKKYGDIIGEEEYENSKEK